MQLDNRTLMFSSLLVTAVLSLLDILIWRMRTTFPGFGRWAIAHALFAPTLLLFSLRMVLPDWVTIGAANIIATILTVIVVEAAREFRGLPPRTWQTYAAGAVNLALIFYFRHAADNLNICVLVAAGFLGGAALCAAKVLLTDIPKDREIGMKYTGWLLLICGLLQVWRGIYYFMQPPMADFFAPTKVNAVSFIGMAVALTGVSFGVIVMSGERLMSDLRNLERQTAKANFELNRLRRGLETAVIERTAELRETQQALGNSQKLESLGRLAGGVAHDFNNFLTVIRGYSRLLAQGLDPASHLRDDVTEMNAACEQAMLLTQQLMAFSRRQSLEPKVLDLNQVILSMAKMLAQLLGDDIEVVIAPGAADPRVKADLGQMHQVILNLFLNARDAMPQGGRLAIETADGELTAAEARRLPDAAAGRYVVLSIRDGGTGMSEETKSHVFEPFFTTKPMGQGTGLGLATVYGIVKQSGGHIQLDTASGRGHHIPDSVSAQQRGTGAGVGGEPIWRCFSGCGDVRASSDCGRFRAHSNGAAARARKRRVRRDGCAGRRRRARTSAAEPGGCGPDRSANAGPQRRGTGATGGSRFSWSQSDRYVRLRGGSPQPALRRAGCRRDAHQAHASGSSDRRGARSDGENAWVIDQRIRETEPLPRHSMDEGEKMRRTILTAFAGCLLAISAMNAQVIVQVAPPRAVVEVRGRAPQPGYVYQRGYHRWDGHAHVWTPGVWVAPPHAGARWVDHRWDHRGHDYVFVEGHWR